MNKHLVAAMIIAASTAVAAPAFASSRYDSASRNAPVATAAASQRGQGVETARAANTNAGTQSVSSVSESTSYILAANDNSLFSHH